MDEFKVKLSKVRKTVQEQNNIAKQMRSLEDEVRQVYSSLSFEVAQREQIRKRLQTAGDEISAEYNGLYKAARALGNIANTYERTDLKLVGAKPKKGVITPLTAAGLVLGLIPGAGPLGAIGAAVLADPTARDVAVGAVKTVFGGGETNTEVKFGEIHPKYVGKDGKVHDLDWSEDPDKKSFWSHNNDNDELEDSEIDPFLKFASVKKEWSKSLVSDENLVGDEEGSHVKTTFDVLKGEANAELYGGLYIVDPETGQKKIRAALGAEMGVALSIATMSQEFQYGDKNLGVYLQTEETLGRGELKGEAAIGLRDAEGNINPTIHGKASAEAIAAEVSAKGGAKVLGADVGVKGSVNFGIGAHAEFGFKDGVLSADVGASLGLGVGLEVEIDVSGTVEAVASGAKAAWNGFIGLFD